MRRYFSVLVLASLSALVGCGDGDDGSASKSPAPAPSATPSPRADEKLALELGEENRSGVSGGVRLNGGENGFTVIVAVKRPPHSGPAHIHDVTCEEYRALKDFDAQLATVSVPLTDLDEGKSRTRVDSPLSDYRTAGFSINVHSYEGGFPVVACGDIPGV